MSLRTPPVLRPTRPLLRESGLVTAALVVLFCWRWVVETLARPLSSSVAAPAPAVEFALVGAATGGLFVAGVALLVVGYAAARGIDAGLSPPTRADLPLLGLAGAVPAALVGLTLLVGSLTGVPYGSLTMTYYGADPSLAPLVTVVGLGVAVAVPCLALVCQVLVQGSLERAPGGRSAVVPTTLAAGFVVTGTGGLTAVPDRGKLLGAALFVALLGVAVAAGERVADDRLRALAYLPLAAFVALAVGSGLAEVGSLAGGLFALTHLAVLGVAAHASDRSDSLLVPAVAYLSLSLSTAVAVALSAGSTPPF